MVRLAEVPEPERTVIAEMDCPAYADTAPVTPAAAAERHVAIVSSAGLILRGERPMLANEPGYRAIPSSAGDSDILCSHVSTNFDRTGFQQDLNVVLARDRLRELQQRGEIGKAADTHYAFMGATTPLKMQDKAREAGRSMLALGVNTVVLAPV